MHQERWETDLVNAEDALPAGEGAHGEEKNGSRNEPQHALGMLSKQGQVSPSTFEFIKLWLKFIIINSTKEMIEDAL